MDIDNVSSWIIAHFFVYQYYVLYDYSVYGYVGASYGSELFGCSFVCTYYYNIIITFRFFSFYINLNFGLSRQPLQRAESLKKKK